MQPVDMLPEKARNAALAMGSRLTGIRLRPGKPIQLLHTSGDMLLDAISAADFARIASELMGHSLYACQHELDMAYFTLPDGSRVGVSGRFSAGGPRTVSDIGGLCIRIAREVRGCADKVVDIFAEPTGTIVVSPPGMGKTTLLREAARLLSLRGLNVCIVDERGELAASKNAMPALDVGPRTDVISGCEKRRGIMLAVRSCAPDIIVTDEIGDQSDAEAVNEAVRCGVLLAVSAHGSSLDKNRMRPTLRRVMEKGVFRHGLLLGPKPGEIAAHAVYDERGCEISG